MPSDSLQSFPALTLALIARLSHHLHLLRPKGSVKAWQGTDEVPAAADPTGLYPAPGTAMLGKPQLRAESITGTKYSGCGQPAGTPQPSGAGGDWCWGECYRAAVLQGSGLVLRAGEKKPLIAHQT